MQQDLLKLATPYLENFLLKYCRPPSLALDLLWKYYVKNEKYSQAARVLTQQAEEKYVINYSKAISTHKF